MEGVVVAVRFVTRTRLGFSRCGNLVLVLSLVAAVACAAGDWRAASGQIQMLLAQGQFEEAARVGKDALASVDGGTSRADPARLLLLRGLATAVSQAGRTAESVALLEGELQALDGVAPNDPGVASLRVMLARGYQALGQNNAAQNAAEQAVGVFEAQHVDDVRMADALAALAMMKRGRTIEELPLWKRALAIAEESHDPEAPTILKMILLGLANYYSRAGEREKSRAYRAQADAIVSGDDADLFVSGSARTLEALQAGEFSKAKLVAEQTYATILRRFGPDHPTTRLATYNLALADLAAGDCEQARQPMFDVVNAVYHSYETSFIFMNENERAALAANAELRLVLFASYVHECRTARPELVQGLYNVALWSKGAIRQSIEHLRERVRASGDDETLLLWNQLEKKRAEYRESVLERRTDMFQVREAAFDLERRLARKLGGTPRARVEWSQVKQALRPGQVAIEVLRFFYTTGRKRSDIYNYAALVLRPEWDAPKYVFLGDDTEVEKIQGDRYWQYARNTIADDAATRFELWNAIENAMGRGVERIFIAPDGILNNWSFAIVPDSRGMPLITSYDVRTVSTTRDLVDGVAPAKGGRSAVVLGNPAFGPPSPGEGPHGWKALSGSGAEADAIAGMLRQHGWQVEPLREAQANKDALLSALHTRPTVLHLATHGFFRAATGESAGGIMAQRMDAAMLQSGIVLAGANLADGESRGVLTALEVSALDLRGAELVVLSACETGVGDTLIGNEVFGLRRAFQLAGANGLLMSMWRVPSDDTTMLMKRFYAELLDGRDQYAALRTAQEEVRRSHPAPYFWGGFVLTSRMVQ